MKHIRQRYNNDCAIACIAMMAGISYKRALKLTNPNRWPFQKIKTPEWDEIRQTLLNLGLRMGEWEWQTVKLSEITSPSMIVVQFSDLLTHAVVWDPTTQQIFDPSNVLNTFYNKYYEKLSITKLSIL